MTKEEKLQAVFDFIIGYKQEHDGVSPSVREILSMTGFHSTSHAYYYLYQLAQAGKIRMQPGEARSIEVIGAKWIPPETGEQDE